MITMSRHHEDEGGRIRRSEDVEEEELEAAAGLARALLRDGHGA